MPASSGDVLRSHTCVDLQGRQEKRSAPRCPRFAGTASGGALLDARPGSQGLRTVPRQSELEGCPFAYFALRPNPAAMSLNDSLDEGEPHSRSVELFGGMQSLEHPEELVGEFHFKTHAVVFDVVDVFPLLLAGADFDDGRFPATGV